MDGTHVRRHARIPHRCEVPRAGRERHRGQDREGGRHPRLIPLFRNDGHVGRAAALRLRAVGRAGRRAGVRLFHLFHTHNRCGPCHQDVGFGLRAAHDGGNILHAATRYAARSGLHSAVRVARDRRQPSADNLLLLHRRRRAVDQRVRLCPARASRARLRQAHGAVSRRRAAGRGFELLAVVVYL